MAVPGWNSKSDAPADLAALIEWLAIRTGWVHDFCGRRHVSDDFKADIIGELGPAQFPDRKVWVYAVRIADNVRCWLDYHRVAGQPIFVQTKEGDFFEADVHLSKVLSFVLDLARGRKSRADDPEKTDPLMPDNPDVRDLCYLLGKRGESKKSLNQIAREFTKEPLDNCPKANSLLRQARRFRHLWGGADS